MSLLREVAECTGRLVAHWQALGFVHGERSSCLGWDVIITLHRAPTAPPPHTHTHARVRTHIFHRLSVHCMHNFTATTALNPPVFSFLTCPCSAFGTPLLCSTAAGVLNTDNMSILGVTIDYGPYGFMDTFDPRYTPNTTDFSGRRYCYQNQPGAAQ